MSNCTCGPYMSVIPPEPCPIHDPERAYWREKYLSEFCGKRTVTTGNTSTIAPGCFVNVAHTNLEES